MTLQNIKLIIWDLDETFWSGTISEEDICLVPQHVRFINALTNISNSNEKVEVKGKSSLLKATIKQKIRTIMSKIKNILHG